MTEQQDQTQEQAEITPAVGVTESTAAMAAVSAEDLGKVRELVLKAHPEVVPELVRGDSIDELIASVTPAQGAYQQIAERVRASTAGTATEAAAVAVTTPAPPVVPAGGTAAGVVDPAVMSPTTKIAQALAARRRA